MTVEGSSNASYTTYSKVVAEFAGNLPPSLTQAVVLEEILTGSRITDSDLPNHLDFPDIAASPPTPPIVQRIAVCRTMWILFGLIAAANRTKPNSLAQYYQDEADKLVKEINDETRDIPREGVTSEALVFGSGDSGALHTDEAPLTKKNIIPETVEVVTPATPTEYNRDFQIYYSIAHRTWVYRGLSTLGQAATHVSYEYSYLRLREIERLGVRTGVLERG